MRGMAGTDLHLWESFPSDASLRVDEGEGVLRSVRVLGLRGDGRRACRTKARAAAPRLRIISPF